MSDMSYKSLLSFSLLVALAIPVSAAQVGEPAPGFTATDINGKSHKLSDYKGKIVVLESYNFDCPFCANHVKTGAMQELQEFAAKNDVVWLLVNSTHKGHPSYRTPEQAKAEIKKHDLKVTAWLDDHSGEIGKLYGMRTTPHMFVINKEGLLAYDGAIDDKPASDGDPRKAKNYVRAALEKLLAGEGVEVSKTRPYGCAVKYGT